VLGGKRNPRESLTHWAKASQHPEGLARGFNPAANSLEVTRRVKAILFSEYSAEFMVDASPRT